MSKLKFFSMSFICLIVLSLSLLMFACNKDTTYIASADNVKQIGRTYMNENRVLWCGQSGTGVEFITDADNCSFNLLGDNIYPEPNHKNARVGFYVNDNLVKDIMMNDDGNNKKTIDLKLDGKNSKVKILKLSEGQDSSFAIESIVSDKPIKPSDSKKLKIEFVGDSISCGYGIECKTIDDPYSTDIENFTKSYAYKTIDALNADYSTMCFSGMGVLSGYTSNDTIEDKIMSHSYTNLGLSDSRFDGNINPQNIDWDFNKFTPDIIVVNLGENDKSYVKDNESRMQDFENAYVSLLNLIREKNPNANILCTYGTLDNTLLPSVKNAVSRFCQTDTKTLFMQFSKQNKELEGSAISGHPSEKTAEKSANELTKFIKENYRDLI